MYKTGITKLDNKWHVWFEADELGEPRYRFSLKALPTYGLAEWEESNLRIALKIRPVMDERSK